MSRAVDDSDELCPEGETLWNNHLKKVDSITTEMSGYHTYLKHIWACKECQKGLGLSRKTIEIQKAHYLGKNYKFGVGLKEYQDCKYLLGSVGENGFNVCKGNEPYSCRRARAEGLCHVGKNRKVKRGKKGGNDMSKIKKPYIEVSDETFKKEVLESKLPVMVDFWARWCRPCLMVAPVVEELAKQYNRKLKVCKIDIDTNRSTPSKCGVMSIPTFLFFKDGKEVGRVIGAVPKETLVAEINKVIGR